MWNLQKIRDNYSWLLLPWWAIPSPQNIAVELQSSTASLLGHQPHSYSSYTSYGLFFPTKLSFGWALNGIRTGEQTRNRSLNEKFLWIPGLYREWSLLLPAWSIVVVLLTYFSYMALTIYGTPAFDEVSAITGECALFASVRLGLHSKFQLP